MTKGWRRGATAAVVAWAWMAGVPAAQAQTRVQCESRNQQYQFCATSFNISEARMVRQISGASCIQGSSWGWDRRGIWVTRGCAGVFEVNDYRPGPPVPPPGPGGDFLTCQSRNYQYEFCAVGPRVLSATMTRQLSRASCVLGRTWGWRSNGIWVNEGCEGEFRIQTDYRPLPPPPGPGVTVCESHEYRYRFCPTGRISSAQILEQKSQAPCIQGRTWGWRNDGIWVDNGCEAVFRVRPR